MIRDGKLFVIEGPDGSGKSTMVSHLIKRLSEKNIPIEDIALPNPDCILYKEIREYLTKQDLDIDVLQSMMIDNMRDANITYGRSCSGYLEGVNRHQTFLDHNGQLLV
jgi:thymidylate kinase